MQLSQRRREDVLSSLKACLSLYPRGVTVPVLRKDYEEYGGEPIPFKEFNCPSLLVFLNRHQSILRIEKQDGQIVIFPVESEKSKHILEFVANQKSSQKSKNRRHFQKPYGGFPGKRAQVTINASLLTQLVELVNNSRNGLSINSALKFLNEHYRPIEIIEEELSRQLKAISHSIVICGDKLYPTNKVPKFQHDRHLTPLLNHVFTVNKNLKNLNKNFSQENKPTIERKPVVPVEKLKNKIPLVIKEKISKSEEDIQFLPAGYSEPRPAENNDKNIVNSENKKVLENGEYYSSKDTKDINSKENVRGVFQRSTEIRLLKLIHKYPNGIWFADLPQAFSKEYNMPLKHSKEFSSMLDFVSHLSNIFHCVKPKNATDFKLFNVKTPLPDLRYEKGPFSPLRVLPDNFELNHCNPSIFKEVLKIGESVSHWSVNEYGIEKDYEEIEISQVISPSFFWVVLRNNLTKFKNFVGELNKFYDNHSLKYRVPVVMLQKGLNVVCNSNMNWCRGIIKEISSTGHTKILLYDYGIEKNFYLEEIYFLHLSFSYLKAQAIPCGLHNVKPYQSSNWSKNAIWGFITKTSFPLIARAEKVNLEENFIHVTLIDTRADDDFFINYWMHDEKLGEPGEMVLKNCNFAFWYYKESLEQKGYDSLSFHNFRSEGLKLNKCEENGINGAEEFPPKIEFEDKYESYPPALRRVMAFVKKSSTDQDPIIKVSKTNREVEVPEVPLPPLKDTISSDVSSLGKSSTDQNPIKSESRTSEKVEVSEDLPPLKDVICLEKKTTTVEGVKNPKNAKYFSYLKSKVQASSVSNVVNHDLSKDKDKSKILKTVDLTSTLTISNGNSTLSRSPFFREHPKENEIEMNYFGTIRSECGGHGRMEDIDWDIIRSSLVNKENRRETKQKSTNEIPLKATTRLEDLIPDRKKKAQIIRHQEEVQEIPPRLRRLFEMQSKHKS